MSHLRVFIGGATMDIKKTSNPEDNSLACHIVVRAQAPDCYAGLRGHDYIAARNLGKLAQSSAQ